MNTTDLWQQLLLISKAMLENCNAEDWQALADNDHKCQMLVAALKKSRDSKPDINMVKEIQAINQQLIEHSYRLKNNTSQELINLRRQVKQSSHYQEDS